MKQITALIILGILATIQVARSADIRFSNAGVGDNWITPANWVGGVVPGTNDTARFNYGGAVGRVTTMVGVGALQIGVDEPGGLIIDGGSLTSYAGWNAAGGNVTGFLTIQNGGSYQTTGEWFAVGLNNVNGTLTINAGLMRIPNVFYHNLYWDGVTPTATRTTINAGGVLDVDVINLLTGVMDIAGGTLIVRQNVTALMATYIADGRLAAFNGKGTIQAIWDAANNRTVVTGHVPAPAARKTYDVNHDGFDDLVHINCESNVFTAELLTSDGSRFTKVVLAGSVTNHSAQDKWFTGDFNGDGKLDLARLWGGADGMVYCEVATNLQSGALNLVPWATALGGYSASQRWFKGDFNGDGKEDLASMPYNGTTMALNVYLSTGAGFVESSWWNSPSSRNPADWFFIGDFNGDGADDIARVYSNGGNVACQLYSANPARTAFLQSNWNPPVAYAYDPDARWYPGDYNGDGRLDFAVVRSVNGMAQADVLLSTGAGLSVNLNWISGSDAYTYGDQTWYPGDFNGDGLTDLVKIYNQNGRLSADVYQSTGNGFNKAAWLSQAGEYQDEADCVLGDFNGDGKDDFCTIKRLNYQSVIDVYRSTGTAFTRLDRTFAQLKPFKSFRGPPAIRAHKYFDPNFIIGPVPADGGDYSAVCQSGQDVYLTQGAVYERSDTAASAFSAYANQQVIETFEAKTLVDFASIMRTGLTQKTLVSIAGYDSVLAQNLIGDGQRYDVSAADVSAGFSPGGSAHFFGGRNGSYQRFNRVYAFNGVGQSVFKIQEADDAFKNVDQGNRIQDCLVFGSGVDARGNGRNPNINGSWADAVGLAHRGTLITNNVVMDGTDVGIVVFTAPHSTVAGNVVASISRAALGGINLLDTLFYPQWGIGGTDAKGRIQYDFSTLVKDNYLDARGSRIDVGIPVGARTWSPQPAISTNNPSGPQILNNRLDGKAFAYGIAIANGFNVVATGNVSTATHSGVGGYFSIPSLVPDPASAFAYAPNNVFNSTYGAEFSPATKPNGLDFLLFNTWNGRTASSNGYPIVFYELPEAEATVELAFNEMLHRHPTALELATYRGRLMTTSTLLADDIRLELMQLPEFDALNPGYAGAKSINGMQIYRRNCWLANLKTIDAISYNTTGNYPSAKSLYTNGLAYLTGENFPVGGCVIENAGGNQLRVTFAGPLWTSSDLLNWQLIDPQPVSPLIVAPNDPKRFYRVSSE